MWKGWVFFLFLISYRFYTASLSLSLWTGLNHKGTQTWRSHAHGLWIKPTLVLKATRDTGVSPTPCLLWHLCVLSCIAQRIFSIITELISSTRRAHNRNKPNSCAARCVAAPSSVMHLASLKRCIILDEKRLYYCPFNLSGCYLFIYFPPNPITE